MAFRLIDIHCNWLWQYATDTTTFDPSAYVEIPGRLEQLSGYMSATSAAVLCCSRAAADWERHADPWLSVADLIARFESEFTGRLLIDPLDFDRWQSEQPDALSWGILAVSGLDNLVRDPADLPRLAGLFKRGIRVFQLQTGVKGRLAGSADPGDDRGLTELGRACLSQIAALSTNEIGGGRPIVDVAHLNQRSMTEVIDTVEAAARSGRLLLMYSHGAVAHSGFDGPRALGRENLVRLRALGGVIGLTPAPPFHHSPEEFKSAIDQAAAIPFEGREGYEGIAVGCDFLDLDRTLPELGNAAAIIEWLSRTFDGDAATLLIEANARRLLAKAVGHSRDE